MSKIEYHKSVPAAVRAELARFVPRFEWLIPAWCQRVTIKWATHDRDDHLCTAETFTQCEYRWAEIVLYAKWLEDGDALKAQTIAHELLHVVTNPFWRYVKEVHAETLQDDEPKLYAHVKAHATRYYEGVVEDLAELIVGQSDFAE